MPFEAAPFGGGSISKNQSVTDWIKPETCQVPAAWAAPGHQKASHHATSDLAQAWDMSAMPRISHDFTIKTCWRFHSLLQRLVDWDPIRPRTLGWMQNKTCLNHQSNNVKRVVEPSPYEAKSRLLPHLPRCRGKILHEGSARSLGLSGA